MKLESLLVVIGIAMTLAGLAIGVYLYISGIKDFSELSQYYSFGIFLLIVDFTVLILFKKTENKILV